MPNGKGNRTNQEAAAAAFEQLSTAFAPVVQQVLAAFTQFAEAAAELLPIFGDPVTQIEQNITGLAATSPARDTTRVG